MAAIAATAVTDDAGAGDGTTTTSMPPPAPRPPKRKVVLEEDAYSEAIEAIIERDFFPDVPKMQNQLEWLEAIQSGDPAQIKRAQQSIALRRAGLVANLPSGTRAGTSVHGTRSILRTPAMTPLAPELATPSTAAAVAQQQQHASAAAAPRAPAMGLDSFLSKFTGEDNASFEQLQEASLARKRAKVSHHLEDKNTQLLLQGTNPTEEYGSSGQQPGTLITWKHVPKSSLYYDSSQRSVVPYTEGELRSTAQGAPRSISHAATRIAQQTEEEQQQQQQKPPSLPPAAAATAGQLGEASDAAGAAAAAQASKAGSAGASAPPPHGTKGYNYMSTPALAPGVEASPLMTWGTIASTPLRLEVDPAAAGGDPLGISGLGLEDWEGAEDAAAGPAFKLPQQRRREVAAMAYIAKRQASSAQARRRSRTPLLDALRRTGTGGRAGAAVGTPQRPLSAAGLKLAAKLRGGSTPGVSGTGAAAAAAAATAALGVDKGGLGSKELRASYAGTPGGRASTPGSMVRSRGGASGGNLKQQQQGSKGGAGRVAAADGGGVSDKSSGSKPVPQQGDVGKGAGAAAGVAEGTAGSGNITDGLLKLG
jgi:protein DGCR14